MEGEISSRQEVRVRLVNEAAKCSRRTKACGSQRRSDSLRPGPFLPPQEIPKGTLRRRWQGSPVGACVRNISLRANFQEATRAGRDTAPRGAHLRAHRWLDGSAPSHSSPAGGHQLAPSPTGSKRTKLGVVPPSTLDVAPKQYIKLKIKKKKV